MISWVVIMVAEHTARRDEDGRREANVALVGMVFLPVQRRGGGHGGLSRGPRRFSPFGCYTCAHR